MDFLQASMLWSLFEFVGDVAWFILLCAAVVIFSSVYAVLRWIFQRLF